MRPASEVMAEAYSLMVGEKVSRQQQSIGLALPDLGILAAFLEADRREQHRETWREACLACLKALGDSDGECTADVLRRLADNPSVRPCPAKGE